MVDENNNVENMIDEELNEILGGSSDPLKEAHRKAQSSLMTNRAGNEQQGVLRYTIGSHTNQDYRQELKLSYFASADEADECVAAINECRILGMDPTPIIDQMHARSADTKHGFLRTVYEALTHQSHSIYTNYNRKLKPQNDQPKGSGPF